MGICSNREENRCSVRAYLCAERQGLTTQCRAGRATRPDKGQPQGRTKPATRDKIPICTLCNQAGVHHRAAIRQATQHSSTDRWKGTSALKEHSLRDGSTNV